MAEVTKIEVMIPMEMLPYARDLDYFFHTMVRKLYTNRHKGFEKDLDLKTLYNGIYDECNELGNAIREEGQFEATIEAVDVANMAFLVALCLWQMDRPTFEEARKM